MAPELADDLQLFAEAARGSDSVEDFERVVLGQLGRSIGYDVAFFVRGPGPGRVAPGLQETVRRALLPRWHEYGAELAEFASCALARGGVGVDREFFGGRALEQKSFYRDIMQPHAGKSTLIGFLSLRGRLRAKLVLGRTSPRFSDREQARLRDVLPTLSVCEGVLGADRSARPTLSELSPREREVVSYLRLGFTNREIALALGTAPRTVRNQLTSIFEKLGASTRAEAVALSLGSGAERP